MKPLLRFLASPRLISSTLLLAPALATDNAGAQANPVASDNASKLSSGVIGTWSASRKQKSAAAGPGDVIDVEVKELVGWVIKKVNALGIFDDPAIDSAPPSVKSIIANYAFEKAVLVADARKATVKGDARK